MARSAAIGLAVPSEQGLDEADLVCAMRTAKRHVLLESMKITGLRS
jgi:hypothetical protein